MKKSSSIVALCATLCSLTLHAQETGSVMTTKFMDQESIKKEFKNLDLNYDGKKIFNALKGSDAQAFFDEQASEYVGIEFKYKNLKLKEASGPAYMEASYDVLNSEVLANGNVVLTKKSIEDVELSVQVVLAPNMTRYLNLPSFPEVATKTLASKIKLTVKGKTILENTTNAFFKDANGELSISLLRNKEFSVDSSLVQLRAISLEDGTSSGRVLEDCSIDLPSFPGCKKISASLNPEEVKHLNRFFNEKRVNFTGKRDVYSYSIESARWLLDKNQTVNASLETVNEYNCNPNITSDVANAQGVICESKDAGMALSYRTKSNTIYKTFQK